MSAQMSGRDGFVLVGVLVFCFILIPVCAVLAQTSRNFARDVRGDVDAFRNVLLAGGFADAVAAKIGSDRALFEHLNGTPRTCLLGDKEVVVLLRDHDGKVDLNNAASELLIAGFEAAGFDGQKARLLQQFVEASRSNTDTPRDILPLVEKVSLKHAAFEHVAELEDAVAALGMPAIDLSLVFTVNRGVGTVEQLTAAEALRPELGTLRNTGIVFLDNGTFDYVDIVVRLHSPGSGKQSEFMKSYRKISPLGDVIEVQMMQSSISEAGTLAAPSQACGRLLGLKEQA